jgi:7-cyano-7-deazaguanine synthase in queuosine biosynthesis
MGLSNLSRPIDLDLVDSVRLVALICATDAEMHVLSAYYGQQPPPNTVYVCVYLPCVLGVPTEFLTFLFATQSKSQSVERRSR